MRQVVLNYSGWPNLVTRIFLSEEESREENQSDGDVTWKELKTEDGFTSQGMQAVSLKAGKTREQILL